MNDAAIDPHTFDELQATAGADFVRTLVDVFAEEAPRLVAEMRAALVAGTPERFVRAAHCLKTDSRTFGATRLAAAARALEHVGAGTDAAAIDALVPEIAGHPRGAAGAGAPMNAPGHERYGRIDIQVHERRLLVDGRAVHLGSRAFDLLAALVARRDRVVPKDELIEQVWPGLVVEDNNLQVQISALRKALGAQTIATVPGRGYRFVAAAATVGGPAQTAPLDPHAHPRAAGRRSRLLVVDDNRLNRLLLCRALELMGHEVETAVDGRAALERLRTEPIDLLLLDLEMPELDGFELLELRAADPVLREIPVIVTSALEGAAHVARCIELGADDYLHKPPNPMLLKARVDASLERKQPA